MSLYSLSSNTFESSKENSKVVLSSYATFAVIVLPVSTVSFKSAILAGTCIGSLNITLTTLLLRASMLSTVGASISLAVDTPTNVGLAFTAYPAKSTKPVIVSLYDLPAVKLEPIVKVNVFALMEYSALTGAPMLPSTLYLVMSSATALLISFVNNTLTTFLSLAHTFET
ncbi:hypothetical protein SDC9_112661 [bioreactor metagenome]|uniref:Uncharacterized protein n=1 Tax=bioreactor metagenome TaxID=1076179 RepID=A0A645BJX7_9ZZZZ